VAPVLSEERVEGLVCFGYKLDRTLRGQNKKGNDLPFERWASRSLA